MELQSIKTVVFSPTGTSKAVAESIARGIGHESVEFLDITGPDARLEPISTAENDLLIIAVPIYMGRVPALVTDYLVTINADKTPAVCVAVYGNRHYDDALLELKNIVSQCGGKTFACAAYIGEHSFSNAENPTAEGRPDAGDLQHAEMFGGKIRENLLSLSSADSISDISVPGNFPYERDTKLWDVDFIAVSDECTNCGVCAAVCPVGAIDSENSASIDAEKCITCCSCIKRCPQKARSIKSGPVMDASLRLHTNFSERREPEYFL